MPGILINSSGRDPDNNVSKTRDGGQPGKQIHTFTNGIDAKTLKFVVSTNTEDENAPSSLSRGPALWKRKANETKNQDLKPSSITDATIAEKSQEANIKRIKPSGIQDTNTGDNYELTEDEFMYKQALEKSKLRIQDGRANELDVILSSNSAIADASTLFDEADKELLSQYLELLEAKVYFSRDPEKAFFEALSTIVKTRLDGQILPTEIGESVSKKIDEILSTKSVQDLDTYENEIKRKLSSNAIVDTNFWEFALCRIPYFKACAILREYNNDGAITTRNSTKIQAVSPRNVQKTDKKYERFMQALKLDTDEHIMRSTVEYKSSTGPKPLFAARVTMSYEWNKYNLAHFDVDNPPPKSVQGFKFSIFYSDLEDPKATPQWKLVKDGNSSETCLLVFKGARPYAPLAFRIPAREWDTDPSRGFKNCFSDGVLHLYFNSAN
uniref:Splicing factor Cactin n=1 Tax=Babesia bovis TaxID=5865 RepID=S6CB44_BABBO|nr:conserved hypothetical protein [Babesia bovis]